MYIHMYMYMCMCTEHSHTCKVHAHLYIPISECMHRPKRPLPASVLSGQGTVCDGMCDDGYVMVGM